MTTQRESVNDSLFPEAMKDIQDQLAQLIEHQLATRKHVPLEALSAAYLNAAVADGLIASFTIRDGNIEIVERIRTQPAIVFTFSLQWEELPS